MNHLVFFFGWVVVLVWDNTTIAAPVSYQRVAAVNGVMNKKCIDHERHALLDFKAHLQHHRGRLSTWKVGEKKDEDCCKWSRVKCNSQTGHVTELNLRTFGLVGEVSPSLRNLTNLTYLDLSGNYFDGTIPAFIGSLSKLTYLDLSINSFNGTIPTSIGSLTALRYLDLSENSLSGTVPRSIGSLTELRSIDLGDNSFNGTIPSEFRNLTKLEDLSLGNLTSCTIENLDWLSHLSRLQTLYMDGTSLAKANSFVNVILNLHKLSSLSLSDCDLSQVMHPYSPSSSVVNSSLSVETIDLRNNNLNSSMHHWLFPFTSNSLVNLYLPGNMLDGIPKYLGNLCSLEFLDISRNSVAIRFSDFLNNLSGCTSLTLQELAASDSQFTGSLSDEIQQFTSLESLDLSDNLLNGTISEKVWELPMLEILDVSNNSLKVVPSKDHLSNLSYVEAIDLSFCKLLGPHFPKWIQKLKMLTRLKIANTGISDTIPADFWSMWPSQLTYLNLASNNITGIVPDLISNFSPVYSFIDLSSNDFYGPIPNVPSSLIRLDLSRNNFYGGLSFLCRIVNGSLSFLDLSTNSLSGQIPDCLSHFKKLEVLNLGHNSLSGRLPSSVESMIKLEGLYLNNNKFSGELPLSLKICTKLTFLDLRVNKFSGKIPVWIGEKLSQLHVLSLASNRFVGIIPLQLCQLVNLQILDLSVNNLHGTIPSCLNNLTSLVQEGPSPHRRLHYYQGPEYGNMQYSEYVDHVIINWQGNVREFSNTLRLVKTIDVSSNNLTGHIPWELAGLHQLLALNLSTNSLQGEIPQKIGEMKQLLTLDLSNNDLTGELPSTMSLMTSLGYLDVSHNNLSGRIPSSTQLQSFDPSRYNGNAGLCGLPLTKYCPGDEEFQVPHTVGESEGDGEDTDELERWFYIGGASGFATGFWIVCCAFLLNRSGRHAFFNFLDNSRDWVFIRVKVFISKFKRVSHAW